MNRQQRQGHPIASPPEHWSVGDRVRRKNGVIGTVTRVCFAHQKWQHPSDHCEMRWDDGTAAPMTLLGLRRMERL